MDEAFEKEVQKKFDEWYKTASMVNSKLHLKQSKRNSYLLFRDAYVEGVYFGMEKENKRLLRGLENVVSKMKTPDEMTAKFKEVMTRCFRDFSNKQKEKSK